MAFDAGQVWTSPHVPELSGISKRLVDFSQRTQATPPELVAELQTDSGLCERIIAAANSPLCSVPQNIESISHAVDLLGAPAATYLGMSLLVRDVYLASEAPAPYLSQCWRQAVVKAVAAEALCRRTCPERAGEFFFAGLLIDVGRLTLFRTVTEKYLAILEKARLAHRPAWQIEQSDLGMTSAKFGSQLLEQWGVPARLGHDIQAQFSPLATLKQATASSEFPSVGIVALASAIGDYFCSDGQALAWFRVRELAAEVLPVSEPELHDLLRQISMRFSAIASTLSVDQWTLPELETLKSNIIEQLRPIHRRPDAASQVDRRGPTVGQAGEGRKSFRDPLTQVYTAEFFEETLYKEVQRCRQNASLLGVAIVHIDRFEKLLQQYGDKFGDVVLQRIGGILKELLRTSDSIARFDYQFGILASEPTAKGMQRLADRIRGRVASEQLMWSGQRVPLTVSVGATLALPDRKDEMIGAKVLATARRAAQEAAMGDGNNIYCESLVDEIELQRLFMSNQLRFSRWLIARGVLDIPRVGKALLEHKHRQMRLGDLALRQELLSQAEVDQILEEQAESDARFGDVAVRRDLLTEDQLIGLLILQQEDPLSVAELFLRRSILTEDDLQSLLKEYFRVVPWAAPLYPTAGNG